MDVTRGIYSVGLRNCIDIFMFAKNFPLFMNIFLGIKKVEQFANIFFCGLFLLYGIYVC